MGDTVGMEKITPEMGKTILVIKRAMKMVFVIAKNKRKTNRFG